MDAMVTFLKGVPGPAWVALVEAIIGWIKGDWFAGQEWVAIAAVVLSGLLQLLKFYLERSAVRKYRRIEVPEAAGWRWYRFFVGG